MKGNGAELRTKATPLKGENIAERGGLMGRGCGGEKASILREWMRRPAGRRLLTAATAAVATHQTDCQSNEMNEWRTAIAAADGRTEGIQLQLISRKNIYFSHRSNGDNE